MRRPSLGRSTLRAALEFASKFLFVFLFAFASGGCRNRGQVEPPPPPEEASPPTGRELVHPSAPITMHLPEGWRDEIEDGSITLIAPADEVLMIMLAINATDLEESLHDLNQELGRIVRGADLAQIEETEINGMSAMVADGRGSLNQQPVDLGLTLLRAPNGRILMIIGIALEDASPQIKDEAETILHSLRATS